ncbi:MAG: DUF2922 domain-containing protein [Synergistaceae bacterium]|jgi:hypothetical protein|nr:DUF2922 domain-containing protein [Synergistaceae bacterium]
MQKKNTLRMKFKTAEDKNVSVSLSGCKGGVTAQDAEKAMDTMLANQIFTFGLAEKRGAAVTETTVTDLF